MTTLRQPYYELSPEVYSALGQAKKALENSALDTTLMELIYLRISQINGCAFVWRCTAKPCVNPAWRKANWMRWPGGG